MANTHQIGKKTQSAQITNTGLSWLSLLLSSNNGDKGNVDESKVVVTDPKLELTHGLNERRRLDITDGTTQLSVSGI
jgi:hypothetical protein